MRLKTPQYNRLIPEYKPRKAVYGKFAIKVYCVNADLSVVDSA